MPRIRSLPRYEPEPGTNPLRAKAIQLLLSAASDPTGIEVGPLGMTRMLKGTRAYHGTRTPAKVTEIHPEVKKLLGSGDIIEKGKSFRYFDPGAAGSGAGGNLYGEGIYLTEHPKIASGYSRGAGIGGFDEMSTVRVQNIPPQAKILDVHRLVNRNEAMDLIDNIVDEFYKQSKNKFTKQTPGMFDQQIRYIKDHYDRLERWAADPNDATTDALDTVENIISYLFGHNKQGVKKTAHLLGYDGISYKAGEVMGLPPGVPEGTKNYVIYNYDIINNPRKVAAERMPKRPKKTEIKKLPSRKELLPDEVHPFEIQQLVGGTFSGQQPFTGASATQNINKRVEALKNALESGVLDDVMKKKGIWIP